MTIGDYIKLFYLINEPFEGYRIGYRNALLKLKEEELISDVYFFSFHALEKQLGNWNNVIDKLIEAILEFKPDIILVAHLSDKPITKKNINQINLLLAKKPIWIYDERDVYGYIRKPIPKVVLEFASNCDLVTYLTIAVILAYVFVRFSTTWGWFSLIISAVIFSAIFLFVSSIMNLKLRSEVMHLYSIIFKKLKHIFEFN